jgi:hypothetical protein
MGLHKAFLASSLRLPISLDSALLKEDLSRITPGEWTRHYNESDYGGEWRGTALRSLSGSANDLIAEKGDGSTYIDTPLLERLSHFRAAVSLFQCPLKAVRLLNLFPKSVIREHSDTGLGPAGGEVRIHIPVQTNPLVEFYLDGERLQLQEGTTYYIDAGKRHRVRNRGKEERIHLVIDVKWNPWLEGIFKQGCDVERIPSAADFEAFRRQVFSLPALQQELQNASSYDAFQNCAFRLGRERGFDFDEEEVLPGLAKIDDSPQPGWVPTAVHFRDLQPSAEFIHIGTRRLAEPFFEDSVGSVQREPFARTFRYEIPLGQISGGPPPAGFIFHMSRCGSTLVAQMFAALSHVSVISEAPPIDEIIQAGRLQGVSAEAQAAWLRTVVGALGRERNGETCYVVKLDAWHIHDLPLIRAAFPETPWVFLYRNPVEVLVSQMRQPGKLALPGAMDTQTFRLNTDMILLSREEWAARVLGGFCHSAGLYLNDPLGLFLNYRELPGAVLDRLCRHFSIPVTEEDIQRMNEAALLDAKSHGVSFQLDSGRKIAEATQSMRDLAEKFMNPPYLELERSTTH